MNEYELDLYKLSKIKNELLEERDHYMKEKMEIKAIEDSYKSEIMQLKDTNDHLDRKAKDLTRKV